MFTIQISKYNPKNRNALGHYLDHSEWTSISDIGKEKYNSPTYQDYKKVEDAYVEAVFLMMKEQGIDSLYINRQEKYTMLGELPYMERKGYLKDIDIDYQKYIHSLHNRQQVNLEGLDILIRLILREIVWMKLDNDYFEVSFGYDYYIYIKTLFIKTATRKQVESNGLYVE